jgi:hypothetical protein
VRRDAAKRENPRNAGGSGWNRKMQRRVQQLLDLLQCRNFLHFADAERYVATVGVGLMEHDPNAFFHNPTKLYYFLLKSVY